MDVVIEPSELHGAVPAVASKSMAHRLLILNALCARPADLRCSTSSEDIEATRRCLRALRNAQDGTSPVQLDVGESGSTLRFLLPVLGALGAKAAIVRHGRLSNRPLSPLDDRLRSHGMSVEERGAELLVAGTLAGGTFVLPGNVSSQFISGLLMAAPLLADPCEILVQAPVQSRPYLDLTIHALKTFGVDVHTSKVVYGPDSYERFYVEPGELVAPESLEVEGDWSNAAFWLAAGALEADGLTVTGLDLMSAQGDRAILAALSMFGARVARRGDAARVTRDRLRSVSLDVGAIPDLVPPLAAVAATAPGTSALTNAGRLRLKESDRLASVCAAITALGGRARVEGDDLIVQGVERLAGGAVDAANDHRIAMMGAVMATHARDAVTVRGAQCVAKSYPQFWDDYAALGGKATVVG